MKDLTTRAVQDRLLKMGKAITSVLEKHQIPYMMAYGTLLGAVRHHGFIPWDDDFDLYLFDDSYDRAVDSLREELTADLFVEDEKTEPLYFHSWAHVKDSNSETYCDSFPQDNVYAHKGISLDLYRTKKMPRCELRHYLNQENRFYIERRREKGLMTDREYTDRMRRLEKAVEDEEREQSRDQTEVYALVNAYRCKEMLPEDIFPLRKYVFEDATFYGPGHAEAVLESIYGDWRKLPPEENRLRHYSSVRLIGGDL